MAMYPDVQAKVQQEIDNVVGKWPYSEAVSCGLYEASHYTIEKKKYKPYTTFTVLTRLKKPGEHFHRIMKNLIYM